MSDQIGRCRVGRAGRGATSGRPLGVPLVGQLVAGAVQRAVLAVRALRGRELGQQRRQLVRRHQQPRLRPAGDARYSRPVLVCAACSVYCILTGGRAPARGRRARTAGGGAARGRRRSAAAA